MSGAPARGPVTVAVRTLLVALALGAAVLLGALPAAAHTELLGVTPGPGETVPEGSQVTVSLTFTEAIDPAFATVVVVDSAEQVIASDPVRVSGADVTQPVQGTLAPGEYVIRYRVVSADGHPVDGESRFVVEAAPAAAVEPTPTSSATDPSTEPGATDPAATDPATEPPATDPAATDPADAGTGGSALPLGLGAAAVAAVVGGGALASRRRASGASTPRDDG